MIGYAAISRLMTIIVGRVHDSAFPLETAPGKTR